MPEHTNELCPRCFIGRPALGQARYATVFRGHLLSIPSLRAYVCDVCGYREYDEASMAWVNEFNAVDVDAADPHYTFGHRHSDRNKAAKQKPQEP